MELGDYIIALMLTAVVAYAVGRMLIAAFFAARRKYFHETLTMTNLEEEEFTS